MRPKNATNYGWCADPQFSLQMPVVEYPTSYAGFLILKDVRMALRISELMYVIVVTILQLGIPTLTVLGALNSIEIIRDRFPCKICAISVHCYEQKINRYPTFF